MVLTDFLYKGKKEVGLLDTGNYTFSPRNNFGKDEDHYNFDFEVNDEILDVKLKKKAPFESKAATNSNNNKRRLSKVITKKI